MKLLKQKCKKQGYESYYDLFLVVEKNGKEIKVRIRPCFWVDMGLLRDVASEIE